MAQANELKPLYLILSTQLFLRTQALDRLKARLEEEGPIDFNFHQYDAETANFAEVVNACNTLPFASDFRLVVVLNIQKAAAASLAPLVEYAQHPSETTVLAIVGETLPASSKLYKAVEKNGTVLTRKAPTKRDLPETLKALAAQEGLTLSSAAAYALVNSAGENLDVLTLSITKIKAYIAPRTNVEVDDIADVVSNTADVRVWDFFRALFSKEPKKAFSLLQDLIEVKRESVEYIMALSSSQMRDLIATKACLARGISSQDEVAKTLGKAPWQARNLIGQARLFDEKSLRDAYVALSDAAHQSRSGGDARTLYECWILEHFGK